MSDPREDLVNPVSCHERSCNGKIFDHPVDHAIASAQHVLDASCEVLFDALFAKLP
jgi:hypothetical protein